MSLVKDGVFSLNMILCPVWEIEQRTMFSEVSLYRYDDLISVHVCPLTGKNNCPASTKPLHFSGILGFQDYKTKADIEKDVSFSLRLFPLLQYWDNWEYMNHFLSFDIQSIHHWTTPRPDIKIYFSSTHQTSNITR